MKALIVLLAALGMASCSQHDLSNNSLAKAVAPAPAAASTPDATASIDEDSALDELDPFDPNVEQKLNAMDKQYEQETGEASHLSTFGLDAFGTGGCRREQCAVWARVERSEQQLHLYINGQEVAVYLTSTGIPGRDTPNFDKHPDGRIFDHYTSTKFPGGDYNGLGNMPYAVFISGGFAIHGTGKSNWKKLGHVASHGCIRVHPDNAFHFNRLVRQYGVANVWITVE